MAPLGPKRIARFLYLLLALFCLRVAGQFLSLYFTAPWLPPFEAWQGSRLPYGVLLTAQLLIIALQGSVAWRISTGRMLPRPPAGRVLVVFGTVYAAVMAARLILGLTVLADEAWFAATIPAFFHIVLAAFVILWGLFHLRGPTTAAP